jgi:protocatechuate 3,4-dioxygenase beta subunit
LLFGNFQLVTFAGTVYNDLNGNGVLDQGDPGLQGWTVNLLDSSGNIVATTTSADDGTYSFSDVGPSTYTIEEVNQTGWYQTEPVNPPGTYTEQAISSTNPSGLDFGNFQLVNVTGQVYNDRNGNGSNDGGTDPGLQGWTVLLLDPSGNTVATTTSDMNGNYMFANLFPGTFTVEEILQAGWIQTQPVNPNYYQFTTQSGMNQTGLDFGNFVNSENFYGTVYNDLVGNGIFDAYDPPLAGWTINVLNSGGSVVATTTSAGDGTYSFTALPVQQYTIQEVTPPGWVITEPTNPPGTYTLPGLSGIYTGLDFGNFQLVSVSGNVYNDLNGNGNQDPGDAGLKGWMVDVINSSGQVVASALTDPNGNYTIGSIGPGSYTLAEVVQSGWVQTQPVNTTYYSFTTSSGTNIAGGIFGNFQTVTLSGEVYNDLNGDGMIDPGDTGFSGWTVNLLNSQDKVIATTTTDSNGNYSFAGVGPGAQTLQEVPQNGPGNVPYLPTVPSTGTIAITPTSGTNRSGLNFGNILQPEVVDVRIDWGSESMSILNLTRNLPFININAIDIIFNENVIVSKADLTLESLINSGNSYNFSGFSYIPATHDAKWSLPTAIGVDSLMMALEGVHVNPGIYLNEFTQKFKVLPGDVNGDGVVNSLDMGVVRNEIVGISPETVWADLDGALDNEGNIVIDMNDYNAVKKRLGSSLS